MPNQIDVTNLTDAFYSQMTSNSDFNTSLGGDATTAGRVRLGQVEFGELSMPFAIYNVIFVTEWDSFQNDGYEALVQLTIYSDAESSSGRENQLIADQARERIHRQSLTVTNHSSCTGETTQTRGPTREGNAWRTDLDFILRGRRS